MIHNFIYNIDTQDKDMEEEEAKRTNMNNSHSFAASSNTENVFSHLK